LTDNAAEPAQPAKRRGRPRVYADEAARKAADAARAKRDREARKAKKAAGQPAPDPVAAAIKEKQAKLNKNFARRQPEARARVLTLGPAGRLPPTLAPDTGVPELPPQELDSDLAADIAPQFPNVASALQYARDIVAGRIPACRWVRLACERHERDLARIGDEDWPYVFDPGRAERAMRAMQMFKEIKGPRAGLRLRFRPWQRFIVASIFGWVAVATGWRRFRYALAYVPRGNGKSTIAAPLGLYMLSLDKEGGAEVYAAAVTRQQARIVFDLAKVMALRDKEYRNRCGIDVNAQAIVQQATASTFRPLSRDAQSLDGLNVHLAILDELAQHRTAEVHDVLLTATGKRGQPLMFAITTAGSNTNGVGYRQWRHAQQILDGTFVDESFFAVLYTIDEGDDWRDEATHQKANPNWAVSVMPQQIQNGCLRAQQIASEQNVFKMKHLNIWTNADVSWMDMDAWAACGNDHLDIGQFAGEDCVIGLDLATKIDLCAKMRLFRREIDGKMHYYAFSSAYLPEAAMGDGRNTSYPGWREAGWLNVNDGDTVDFVGVQESLIKDAQEFKVIDVAYDPWQGAMMAAHLDAEDIPVIEYRPTVANQSAPLKEIDALVREGRLHHNNDPVLAWCVSCVRVMIDYNDNIKPRKDRNDPLQKIDCLIALVMALGRWMAIDANESSGPSLMVIG